MLDAKDWLPWLWKPNALLETRESDGAGRGLSLKAQTQEPGCLRAGGWAWAQAESGALLCLLLWKPDGLVDAHPHRKGELLSMDFI